MISTTATTSATEILSPRMNCLFWRNFSSNRLSDCFIFSRAASIVTSGTSRPMMTGNRVYSNRHTKISKQQYGSSAAAYSGRKTSRYLLAWSKYNNIKHEYSKELYEYVIFCSLMCTFLLFFVYILYIILLTIIYILFQHSWCGAHTNSFYVYNDNKGLFYSILFHCILFYSIVTSENSWA